MNPRRYASVCSGIEAASVAWKALGWTCDWVSEIESAPSTVLAYRHQGVSNRGDFTKVGFEDDAAECGPDVLVGGTPCQDFSVAGLRQGLGGQRGNLTLEFLRLAGRIRPRWIVWENVPGVLSIDRGRAFGAFLGGLEELGYGWAYRTLDAQFVGGCEMHGDWRRRGPVPQHRRRVFVVAYSGRRRGMDGPASREDVQRFSRVSAAVLFERDCLSGDTPTRRKAGEGSADRSEIDTGECFTPGRRAGYRPGVGTLRASGGDVGPGSENLITAHSWGISSDAVNRSGEGDGSAAERAGLGIVEELSPALRARPNNSVAYQCHGSDVGRMGTLRAGHGDVQSGVPFIAETYNVQALYSEGKGPHARRDEISKCLDGHGLNPDCQQGGTLVSQPIPAHGETAFCLPASSRGTGDGHGQGWNSNYLIDRPIAFQERGREAGRTLEYQEDQAYSLNAPNGGGRRHEMNIQAGSAVRRLTPVECERLQGFPDDYTLVPTKMLAQPIGKMSARKLAALAAKGRIIEVGGITYQVGSPRRLSKLEGLGKLAWIDGLPWELMADGPRYKMIGNSMAIVVMQWLGMRLDLVDGLIAENKPDNY